MSEAEIETVRRGVEAFNRRDLSALFEVTDPKAEFIPLRSVLEGTSYRGHDGLRRFFEDTAGEWDELTIEGEEWRDLGDWVLVIGRFHARGRGSGVELHSPAAWLVSLREGRIAYLRAYSDVEEAVGESERQAFLSAEQLERAPQRPMQPSG